MALPLIVAGISAAGAVFSGIASADASSYQAQVAKVNQQIAQQNAQYAIEAGQAKTFQQGQAGAAQAGNVKTQLAANGTDVNSGSAVAVESGTRELSEVNEQTTMNNAELQAYGYKSQATGFGAQAGLDEAQAEEAPIGAALGAAGSLAEGASGVGFKWGGGGDSLPSSGLFSGNSGAV